MWSWLGRVLGCMVEAHGPRFDSGCCLNALDYSVLIVAGIVNTSRLGFSYGEFEGFYHGKFPGYQKKKKKKRMW